MCPRFVPFVLVVAAAVGCAPPRELAELRALDVHAMEEGGGWYRLTSEDGYSFRMPGLPLAARDTYVFAGHEVPTLFYDLSAEGDARGYLLRAFDVSRISDDGLREEVRQQAEQMILEVGDSASAPRERDFHGARVIERDVEGLSSLNRHHGLLRTLVWGGFVFQLLVLMPPASGDPQGGRRFLDSLRLQE